MSVAATAMVRALVLPRSLLTAVTRAALTTVTVSRGVLGRRCARSAFAEFVHPLAVELLPPLALNVLHRVLRALAQRGQLRAVLLQVGLIRQPLATTGERLQAGGQERLRVRHGDVLIAEGSGALVVAHPYGLIDGEGRADAVMAWRKDDAKKPHNGVRGCGDE